MNTNESSTGGERERASAADLRAFGAAAVPTALVRFPESRAGWPGAWLDRTLAKSRALDRVVVGIGEESRALQVALTLQPMFKRVGMTRDGSELLEQIADGLCEDPPSMPDLVVASRDLPLRSGLDILADVRGVGWAMPFILVVGQGDDQEVRKTAWNLGAIVLDARFELTDLQILVKLGLRSPAPDDGLDGQARWRRALGARAPGPLERQASRFWKARAAVPSDRRGASRRSLEATVYAFHDGRWRTGQAVDAGPHGICFRTVEPLPKGTLTSLIIAPADSDEMILALSEVVHVTERVCERFDVGVQLIEVSGEERTSLDRLLRGS